MLVAETSHYFYFIDHHSFFAFQLFLVDYFDCHATFAFPEWRNTNDYKLLSIIIKDAQWKQ